MTPTQSVSKVVELDIDTIIRLPTVPWDEIRGLLRAVRKRRVRIILETDLVIEDYRLLIERHHLPYDLIVDRGARHGIS